MLQRVNCGVAEDELSVRLVDGLGLGLGQIEMEWRMPVGASWRHYQYKLSAKPLVKSLYFHPACETETG